MYTLNLLLFAASSLSLVWFGAVTLRHTISAYAHRVNAFAGRRTGRTAPFDTYESRLAFEQFSKAAMVPVVGARDPGSRGR